VQKIAPVFVGASVVLLCFAFGCRDEAEKAELEKSRALAKVEEQNAEKHAHEQGAGIQDSAGVPDASASRQDELTHPGEEEQNSLQPPEKIMDAIGLKPGMVIGEVGAGWGRFTVHLARRVGNNGLVYANDIDKGALNLLEQRSKRSGLGNIKIILGQVHDPCFPPRSLDMVFMINVYNAFEDPARFLRNIAPALKPGGTLAIVLDDPAKSGGESERSATREEFLASVDNAGYKVEKEETFLERDGLFVLRLK
jgi:SAM-dependent methyltransferase